MQEGPPDSPGLAEDGSKFTERHYELLFGSVVAFFTPKLVLGNHPKEMREALEGVTLPVHEQHKAMLDEGTAQVSTGQVINALAASRAEAHTLDYWAYSLPDDPMATLDFPLEKGALEYLDDRP